MRSISRSLAAAALASVFTLVPADLPHAQTTPSQAYDNPLVVKDAERLDGVIRALGRPRQGAAELRRAGLKALDEAKEPREAVQVLGQALAVDGRHAATWTALARAYLAVTPEPSSSERFELPSLASGAAWRAYQLATEARDKAAALALLGEALKARSLWRPAIDALDASLKLVDDGRVREALARLRAEHGFRMVDYKVDADTAEPRICLNFSERLSSTQGDLAKFVAVDGRDPQNATVEGRQLCLDGLAHGKRYEIQVRAGLPSEAAEALARPAELAVFVRDRAPAVRFTGRAYVLPSRGQQGVPVVTVNTAKVAVEIYRVGDRGLAGLAGGESFLKQMQGHDLEQLRERQGQRVWTGELDVVERPNEDVTTAIPVSEAIGRLEPGVYIVTAMAAARPGKESSEKATQWFVISDLGLSALSGEDGIHGFVRSIASAEPATGVSVRLVARNNEVLATARTDAAGYVRFGAGLKRGEGGMAPALLVAETGADYAFLDLATAAFDLTDRGVKGREQPGALDAYLVAERGVYRPGEQVHLTGLVRDRAANAATLPVTLIVLRPDGVEHRRIALPDQGLGGRALSLDLAKTAMTGTWRARLHADPKAEALAQAAFLVEDFVPERLDMTLTPATQRIAVEETGRIAVSGKYLYGPPAAGLELEGEVVVTPATGDLEGLPGYRFGRTDELIGAVRKPLEDLSAADAQGRADVLFRLPPIPRTERLLEAEVIVRLKEPGGRAIERRAKLPVSTGSPRVGVKPLFAGSVGDGDTAEFDVALVGADGRAIEGKGLRWELVRLDQRWQWYARDGQWSYEAITTTRRVAVGAADTVPGKPARISVKPDWGRYRLDVTSIEGGRATTTSIPFNVGWYGTGDSGVESPEALDIALDKPAYKAGETAHLRIASREGGRVQIAVLSNGLLHSRQVEVPAGGGQVALDVKGEWLPGAYVTATLFRPMDEKARRMPSRAIGVRWLGVDASERQLKVAMEVPRTVKPDSRLEVPLKLTGLAPGEEARVTVAAVDVGILNLTRYEAPAPERWFHAQRRLGTEFRDLYGRLIDGMRAERGRLRSGGDGGADVTLKGSPPVEKPLSLFSGIVTVGADGTAKVAFDLPDFNGTVRLMAVAWSGTKVGSGQADVVVRETVALTATAPRFLTLGDTARLAVDLHNIEAPVGGISLSVAREADGGARTSLAQRDMQLKAGERRAEHVAVKADALGRQVLDVEAIVPGGVTVRRRIAVDVKPPSGDVRRVVTASLAERGGKLTLSKDLLADLIPGSARISLVAGLTARLDTASLLTQLDRYPHGCAEQTTSRALPLLYVAQMAMRLGLAAEEADLRQRIEKAVERVLEMQEASGAFGVWGPSGGDLWLTAYVTDFLTRAKEQGFAVQPQRFTQALDRLANYVGYAQDFEKGGEARAYALYVLARNGRAPTGDLRWLADTRLERFATPLAQAQLGAALALTGDRERAERAFRAAVGVVEKASEQTVWNAARSDYGSFLRDGAGIVTLASETGIARAATPGLTGVLASVYRTRKYTSTQEQAWMLLAARALSEEARDTRLSVDGREHRGELSETIDAQGLATRPVEIVNAGDKAVDAVVSVVGSSLTPEPAVASGFTIARKTYTLDGKEIDLATAGLKQNDRVVVVLEIAGTEAGGRVIIVDRLPAGLEIENPRLVAGGELKGFEWLEKHRDPTHSEFRDDRFVAAFDFFAERQRGGKPAADHASKATVAYVARAVTPGSFVHPAATVEDMYRPERFARTATGKLEIGSRN